MDDIKYRRNAIRSLTNDVGVYALCDLERTPLYVGQSTDGIQNRVRRHLTSARSDIIANRQIDVWEVAYVYAFPCDKAHIDRLEGFLYHHYNNQYHLMNGTIPKRPSVDIPQAPDPSQIVQVIPEETIKYRLLPSIRAARQAEHYCAIIDHFLTVKQSNEIGRSMEAHLWRLIDHHKLLLSQFSLFDEAAE